MGKNINLPPKCEESYFFQYFKAAFRLKKFINELENSTMEILFEAVP